MIIKKLKETLLGISKEMETQTSLIEKKNIHCKIDNQEINCDELEAPIHEYGPSHFSHGYSPYGNIPSENRHTYTGIPAPVVLSDDPWFSTPIRSEKQLEYMQQEIEMKRQERENNFSVELDDIHQRMYEIATKNQNTTLDLNPISPGGSENFHEGPGGWSSGTGQNQFR